MEIEIRNRNNINQSNQTGESIIISIADPDNDHPEIDTFRGLQSILKLSFHDITPAMNVPEKYKHMSDEQAVEVAEFIKEHKDIDKLIVQCDAGISRSAGLGAGVFAFLSNSENEILTDSRYIPNMWVYYQTLRACLLEPCPPVQTEDVSVKEMLSLLTAKFGEWSSLEIEVDGSGCLFVCNDENKSHKSTNKINFDNLDELMQLLKG